VEVNGDDPETALRVILTRKSTDAERARAERPFDHDSAQTPLRPTLIPRERRRSRPSRRQDRSPTPATQATGRSPRSRERGPRILLNRRKNGAPIESAKPVSRPNTSADDIVSQARDAADRLTDGLPNFLVQQNTTRYFSRVFLLNGRSWTPSQPKWQA